MNDASPPRRFLFLSDSNAEAATSRLAVAGIPYKKKKLESSPENWVSICELIDEGGFVAVLIKLTTHAMRTMIRPDYGRPAEELLQKVAELPNMVFTHASFFDGAHPTGIEAGEDEDEWFGAAAHFGSLELSERTKVMEMLDRHGIQLMPYRRNAELSVLAAQFVDDHRRNLVFRFYIPAGRLWADQAGSLLDLFKDYLVKAVGLKVRTSSHTSANGTTHEFFTDDKTPEGAIQRSLPAFATAMELCVRDPDRAERLLVSQGADALEVSRLVTNYAKRMKRITSDVRQEREHKVLALRHQLENDLADLGDNITPGAIATLVECLVPRADQASALVLGLSDQTVYPPAPALTLNYKPQFINQVQGLVAHEVHGTQNFGADAQQILELVNRLGGDRSEELSSALHTLQDSGVADAQRLAASGKLKAFLAQAASKVGDKALETAIAAGQAYLQKLIGL